MGRWADIKACGFVSRMFINVKGGASLETGGHQAQRVRIGRCSPEEKC